MKKGDIVRIATGRNAGVVGEVFWFGVTRKGTFSIGVKSAANGQKVWALPAEVVDAKTGLPVDVDEANAPLAKGAVEDAFRAGGGMTRRRSVGDVRDLEARVQVLETLLVALQAEVTGLKAAKAPARKSA